MSLILGLERLADMADYLGYVSSAIAYRKQAMLTQGVDRLLWNSMFYASTIGAPGYDLMDIAQAVLGKSGTEERRVDCMEKLLAPWVPTGYINGTRFMDTPHVVNPYCLSFLLEGLAMENQVALAQELLDDTWGPMVRRDINYTGGYWEDVVSTKLDGVASHSFTETGAVPLILNHAPDRTQMASVQALIFSQRIVTSGVVIQTVFLTEYAPGIRPKVKAYSEFLFSPLPWFKTEWVQGRVPTPF